MTRHGWAEGAAVCFALTGCDHPAGSAASTPSADSYRTEVFEVRIGEAIGKIERRLGDDCLPPGSEGPADGRSIVSRPGISNRRRAGRCDRRFALAAALRRRPSANRKNSQRESATTNCCWDTAEDVSVPHRRRTLDTAESVKVVPQTITLPLRR